MPYFADLHTYLHRSSQLIQAYPSTRITTKYSLPRKTKSKSESEGKKEAENSTAAQSQQKRERSATLTLKTYHPESGICLKYGTDKAAEVGRLLAGLGRLAKGELIEMPTMTTANGQSGGIDADKMDIDSGVVATEVEPKVVAAPPAATQTASGGGGGKGKKKKGKK